MDKEKMQDIKERLDLFPSNMNEPAQKAYCELFDYIENLEQQCKKQKEVFDKIMNLIKQYGKYDGKKCTRGFQMWSADFNKILDMLKEEK